MERDWNVEGVKLQLFKGVNITVEKDKNTNELVSNDVVVGLNYNIVAF